MRSSDGSDDTRANRPDPKCSQILWRFAEVLNGVDLDIDPGEVVCIIGPSGSGKTTMLRCINFLENYQAGIDSRRWRNGRLSEKKGKRKGAPEKEIARIGAETAMVFQSLIFFPTCPR